jgi:hypothetical protein
MKNYGQKFYGRNFKKHKNRPTTQDDDDDDVITMSRERLARRTPPGRATTDPWFMIQDSVDSDLIGDGRNFAPS